TKIYARDSGLPSQPGAVEAQHVGEVGHGVRVGRAQLLVQEHRVEAGDLHEVVGRRQLALRPGAGERVGPGRVHQVGARVGPAGLADEVREVDRVDRVARPGDLAVAGGGDEVVAAGRRQVGGAAAAAGPTLDVGEAGRVGGVGRADHGAVPL